MKPFQSDLQFSGRELVWLNALGRARQPLEGRGDEGADPNQTAVFQLGPGGLSPAEDDTGRQNCRKRGTRWSLQNVKHGVGGGFV